MSNWDIVGHDAAVAMLKRDLAHDRVRHAYLFTGPEGVGKRTLVTRFAQALLCANPAEAPCGLCRACTLVLKNTHPDLLTVAPVLSGKRVRAEKIKIEPVRQLIYDLALKPNEATRRVARLLRFDAANGETMNAFLKTLEEPPNNVVILLTAERAEDLLPTIVSRCELIQLRPLPIPAVREALITRWLVSSEQADLLAHLSGGRLGWAVRLHTDSEALDNRAQKLDDLRTLLIASRVSRFAYAEKLARDNGLDQVQATLDLWSGYWRDVLLTSAHTNLPLANPDQADHIHSVAQSVTPAAAHAALTALRRTQDLLERNVNARLALEVMLMEWPKVEVSATMTLAQQLWQAAREGDLAAVNASLQAGADTNAREDYGDTALNLAAEYGHLDVVTRLLEAGADLENLGGAAKTPLMNAAFAGRVKVVELLLSRGARISYDLMSSLQLKINILEENAEAGMVNPAAAEAWKKFFEYMLEQWNLQNPPEPE